MRLKFNWSKKKKRIPPADTICRNCGVRTMGRYCHKCGQDIFADTGRPIFELLGQLFSKAFALDGRTPVTLKNLMIRPGFLSSEYRLGRINRYVHPVKLFWFSTLVFFALMISQIDADGMNVNTSGGGLIITKQPTTAADSIIENTVQTLIADILPTEESEVENETEIKKDEKQDDSKFTGAQIVNYFAKYGPFVAFLLIPIFALLLALFFWRNKLYYMYHLVFAVHYHTFLWIFFSLLFAVNIIFPNVEYPEWLKFILFWIPAIYLSIAMRRYYLPKRWRSRWIAIWKSLVINFIYSVLVLTVTVLLIVLLVKMLDDGQSILGKL